MASIEDLFTIKPEEGKKEKKDTVSAEAPPEPLQGEEPTIQGTKPTDQYIDGEVAPATASGLFSDPTPGKVPPTESLVQVEPTTEEAKIESTDSILAQPETPTPQSILDDLVKSFPSHTKEQLNSMINDEITRAAGLLTYEAAAALVGNELAKQQDPLSITAAPGEEQVKATDFFSSEPVVEVKPTQFFGGAAESAIAARPADLPAPKVPTTIPEFEAIPVAKGQSSKVFTIYGYKGDAKTTLALSFPGKIFALSFDNKTAEIWEEMYKNDERIIVYNATMFLDYSSAEAWVRSSDISLRFVDTLLEGARKFEPDWIFIDAVDGFIKMAEMTMRYRNNLSMTQGVEWQYWKYRRLYIKQLHHKASEIAKKGIIYTAFVGDRKTLEGGRVTESKEEPKWLDIIKEETDVVIRMKSHQEESGRKFTATVESSKWGPIRTGARVDITVAPGQVPDCLARIVAASRR